MSLNHFSNHHFFHSSLHHYNSFFFNYFFFRKKQIIAVLANKKIAHSFFSFLWLEVLFFFAVSSESVCKCGANVLIIIILLFRALTLAKANIFQRSYFSWFRPWNIHHYQVCARSFFCFFVCCRIGFGVFQFLVFVSTVDSIWFSYFWWFYFRTFIRVSCVWICVWIRKTVTFFPG